MGRILDDYFIEKNKYEMFYASHQHRFIYGVIQSPEEVLSDPQFAARGYFVETEQPPLGRLKFPGAPFEMQGTPWELRSSAPAPGQHNRETLGGRLGYSDGELAQLRAEGVI